MVPIMFFVFVGHVWAGVPNPAAVYCKQMGFDSEVVTGLDGAQHSICVFPDGHSCDAWEFLQGLCGEEHSYCAQQGFDLIVKDDGKDPFSNPYAVCVNPETGEEVGSVTGLLHYPELLNVGMWPQPTPVIRDSPEPSLDLVPTPADPPLPSSFDWRNQSGLNWMTSVKDQSQCGSCWFFSAVGTVEAVYNIHQNNPTLGLNLSEEYGVADCNGNGDGGCCGGFNDHALKSIRDEGTPDEACMPYNVATYNTGICSCYPTPPCVGTCPDGGGTNSCSLSACASACPDVASRLVKIKDYHNAGANNVNTMKKNLVDHGPLSVCLNFGGSFDTSVNAPFGVYKCTSTNTTHCIVIVGWDDAINAWIAKNSWGDTWGPHHDGYLEVRFGQCGIESVPFWAEPADIGFPIITIAGNVTFKDTCEGSTSTETLKVHNTGKGDLRIDSIVTSDSQFSVIPPSSGFPVLVSPDSFFEFQVTFEPTTGGQKTATLIINSNDLVRPSVQVLATGNSTFPVATTSGALGFGQFCIGDSETRTVQLCDTGKCDLRVTGAALVGPNCADFTLISPSSSPLAISPDSCFGFVVKFSPTSLTPPNCSLRITTNDPAKPIITVPITATVGSPQIVLDPTALSGLYAFPATVVDSNGSLGCYSDKTLVIRNNGTCPLNISGITATSPFNVIAPTQFPVKLPPGQETLNVVVRFKPTAGGGSPTAPDQTTGTLTVTSNNPTGPATAGICGEAVVQSGIRVLVVDGSDTPIAGLDRLRLRSKGIHTPSSPANPFGRININLTNVSPTTATVCNNTIMYHLDSEELPPAQTPGSSKKSSYHISAEEGNKRVNQSFGLGQCEFKQFILKLR